MTLNLVELFELFEFKKDDPVSISVILNLQSWWLIANENTQKCKKWPFFKIRIKIISILIYYRRCARHQINVASVRKNVKSET